MERKIIGIGETVLDVIFRNDQPQSATPGGSTFNSMISLGRVVRKACPEVKILMVTEVGDDHIGHIVTDFMEQNGVGTEAVTRNPGTQTHVSMAFLDDDNNAQYEFYKDHASASLSPEKVLLVEFSKDDLVLFGSFFAINPKIRAFTKALLEAARKAGATIYYDINFRKSHVHEIPVVMENIRENCRLSDVVRGSDEDFGYLFGTTDPCEIYHRHISELCPNFICTCGFRPVHVFMPGYHETFPVPEVETVSTIGAGDNFNAGFLFGLLRAGLDADGKHDADGGRLENPSGKLSAAVLPELIGLAGRFSANVCASINNNVDENFVDSLI
ncbi:MAG: carbohydrate kinase [Bacteroidales bacterium]|nr:carbohydrate kinase [Bacteroidales bacterium]